ncbi:MAG: hypothetical protein CV082_08590 [Candidatus Brocadia sp. BL1]|nr:MAG: hypothetical protein CV082_08590 [Candidatus Brocadia sp. BL1]
MLPFFNKSRSYPDRLCTFPLKDGILATVNAKEHCHCGRIRIAPYKLLGAIQALEIASGCSPGKGACIYTYLLRLL